MVEFRTSWVDPRVCGEVAATKSGPRHLTRLMPACAGGCDLMKWARRT